MFIATLFTTRTIHAQQVAPCGTNDPSSEEKIAIQQILNAPPPPPPIGFTWEIPVRVTVFYNTDESIATWPVDVDEAYIDGFLSDMNTKLVGAPNTFHFFRCGPITNIYSDQLLTGAYDATNYAYSRNFLNLYLLKSSTPPTASFPWDADPKRVSLTSGTYDISIGNGFHELGHTIGLYHPFEPRRPFLYPVTPGQVDHPEVIAGRELVIRGEDPNKEFKDPNFLYAGDQVEDTPPGCNQFDPAGFYPSMSSLSPGCYDHDPSTPCINYCQDNNNTTPCVSGCTFDFTNCVYSLSAMDYNLDPLSDPLNVLAKNHMSYTLGCGGQFTQGQKVRADQMASFFLNNYYEEEYCESLNDRVEIEDSNEGFRPVSIRITPVDDITDYTQTVVQKNGDFSGKLSELFTTVTADLKRYKEDDIAQLERGYWLEGLTTYDLVCITKHILGFEPLKNGYKLVAADANNSNSITTFDVVELRKLIIGIYQDLPAFQQPWRFIPEAVTETKFGIKQPQFDGVGFDDPFHIPDPFTGIMIGPNTYCSNNFHFRMERGRVNNGFDVVKIGDVCKAMMMEPGDCPGDIAMVVPDIEIPAGSDIELSMKAFSFQSVAAFQAGLKISKEDFEFIGAASSNLEGFSIENSVGGLNLGQDNVKIVWLNENLTPITLPNGSSIFKINLLAKKNIPSLSDAVKLDNSVMETFFLSPEGGCLGGTNLEMTATFLGGTVANRNREITAEEIKNTKLFCIPNPANDHLTLLFDADYDFNGNILIHNLQGQLLTLIPYKFSTGRNLINLNEFFQLPSGIFNISILEGGKANSARVEKI